MKMSNKVRNTIIGLTGIAICSLALFILIGNIKGNMYSIDSVETLANVRYNGYNKEAAEFIASECTKETATKLKAEFKNNTDSKKAYMDFDYAVKYAADSLGVDTKSIELDPIIKFENGHYRVYAKDLRTKAKNGVYM